MTHAEVAAEAKAAGEKEKDKEKNKEWGGERERETSGTEGFPTMMAVELAVGVLEKAQEEPRAERRWRVSTWTWLRDSEGLYDFEAGNVRQNTLDVIHDCYLVRHGNNVSLQDNPETPGISSPPSDRPLLALKTGPGSRLLIS